MAQSTNATNPSHAIASALNVPISLRFMIAFIVIYSSSLRHFVHFKVPLRRNSESICHTIEKGKHRRDVDGFCNLRLSPSMVVECLHIFLRGAIGALSHLRHVVQQSALRRT